MNITRSPLYKKLLQQVSGSHDKGVKYMDNVNITKLILDGDPTVRKAIEDLAKQCSEYVIDKKSWEEGIVRRKQKK